MELHLPCRAFWASLHLRSGLLDWDMAAELGLGPPPQGLASLAAPEGGRQPERPKDEGKDAHRTEVKPHLWMWVDPNKVCPIPGRVFSVPETPSPPGDAPPADPQEPPSDPDGTQKDPVVSAAGEAEKAPSGAGPGGPPKAPGGLDAPAPKPKKPQAFRSHGRRLKRTQGEWPRPPLNYCILISLALRSSVDSSLTVQEIYQFTRQHFPFFRTAPEGWKNTVRHNLCFSSSFEKTTDFVCLEGSRKSRLWRLTSEGRRRFREEAQALPTDQMGLVHQSMDRPELLRPLFGL
ncbi:forkhead box protein R1 [Anolis carolinensis]|uniref:forkhead box protein R1 n=1 Tax=Anolis carolinensis TaxID=28377 RepID=UPI002F2B5782